MRRFILYSNTGSTSGDFNINDLPGDGGRMDLVARSVISCLWVSGRLREETKFIVSLNGPPNSSTALLFDGGALKGVRPNERSIGLWIKKVLNERDSAVGLEWSNPTSSNIKISKKNHVQILDDIDGDLFLMSSSGKDIREEELKNPTFILGDHLGIKKQDLERIRGTRSLSVGPETLFASQTITVLNNELDRRKKGFIKN